MTSPRTAHNSRRLRGTVPVAVLGTLAGTLVGAPTPAVAAQPASTIAATPDSVGDDHARSGGAAAPASYTVQPGDTVSSIARKHGLETVAVLSWNGLGWRSIIRPGQVLTLTGGASAPATTPPAPASTSHTVVAGDTVFAIARAHGTTVDAVLAANGLSRASIIYPGQTLLIGGTAPVEPAVTHAPAAATASTSHTVVAGDTLFGIARRYGTTVRALSAANGLGPDSVIHPGQKITLSSPSGQKTAALDAEQAENAALIIRIGRELGVPDRGIAIALATSMVESWMRNLDWGDRDSVGLFQQRPSTGWGDSARLRDRHHSIRLFYGGPHDPNGSRTRGLLDIAGWQRMGFSAAAQAVQISAYPDRYGQWETQAYEWLALYG